MSSTHSMQTDAVPSADVTRALAATPAVGSTWKSLYKIGAAAALFGVAMIPIQMIVFIVWPPPDTAIGWFTLFQNSTIAGLLAFEGLFIVNAVLGILTALALYIALRRVNESLMAIATTLALVEAIALIVARPAFDMLYLSQHYAAATTDAQRSLYLAAGEAMWATFNGTAFHLSYNLFSIYLLIVPVVILRSSVFSRLTAYVGILAAILNWGLYVPKIGLFLSILSVVPLAIWLILIARRLFQLGQGGSQEVVNQKLSLGAAR
jgi:uncharacterized protein DUF4386